MNRIQYNSAFQMKEVQWPVVLKDKNIKKMKKVLAFLAGAFFSIGWFIWIDGHVYENHRNRETDGFGPSIQWVYYLPGIFATVALVMTNIVNIESLSGSSFLSDEGTSTKIRIWLFLSFAISFGCVAAAIWIMAAVFMPPHNKNSDAEYPGIALTVQNVMIFISSLTLMYSKSRREENEF
ncbi:transmembrane protein [Heterostelium album PN500]|uniref:Transmembrane protein n=1 Tax=Heterostelium pallidum (strain ATCC 26659 / Pp 5 / PN500) TaxID=670386 RepID=D3B4A4_HETP5|nr:transmembrane protein [Heterostelium album PN500]EFA84152.1 transmembrane protein [Heterostelium album PN500]|eukprot:XP_020436269.1 transmembrane protein [Heterostelium album PN500]